MAAAFDAPYPVRFDVDREAGARNRLTVAFRIFLVIPIAIVLATVSGGGYEGGGRRAFVAAGGLLFAGPLVIGYAFTLVTDRYPPFGLAA